MSELKPIDDGLAPEVVALAQALRDLFAGLGISTRRYAARRTYDSSAVSRFLGGRRLPPWEFVLNLLHDVAEERGTAPTEETIGMLRTLHTAAVQSGNGPVHKVQLLERKLAEADQEARRAAARERWLEDTLQDREHRIRDLQMRFRELQAMPVSPLTEPVTGAPSGDAADEHARLRAEIRELQAELERVRALHRQAEERCGQLERQLADAEETAQREGEVALLPELLPLIPDGSGAAFRSAADVRNEVVNAPGALPLNSVYQFGHIHGDVSVVTDTWQVDEEFVASVSVRLCAGDEHVGNGLLFDAETVITTGVVLERALGTSASGHVMEVVSGELRVRAEQIEIRDLPGFGSHGLGVRPSLAVLHLAEPVAFPDQVLVFDWRHTPGRQSLVSAYAMQGRYSCLLDVKGRSGDWLRVSGELVDGLFGAPAFSSTGALTGLVAARSTDKRAGLLLPVSAFRALTTITLGD
ncbi:hypothetical protein BM536_014955 [Streptomyces phaeoluteigriseus]|uniref:Uncharacterized protein n=1 Tax=Streptomyces phaeoluteigriseus TaxID=114686 RepID=A0A1V6MTJ8_9ACTN|nr:hypothetical protein [Streptomyces phaeoluteigriseus]OQD55769.1 hypothetical protein BM536_014955 [Streptomyces phaeoluteigriseus]